jgi:heme o synthase
LNNNTIHINHSVTSIQKILAYYKILKLRLSLLVAFSAGIGYLLGTKGAFDWVQFCIFTFSGLAITGASNIINQIIERNSDKLMHRTQNRPMPTGTMSVFEASIFAGLLTIVGVYLMIEYINFNTAWLSVLSLLLYAFAYTPLKTKNQIAVFIGAIPGALPPMIGWVAATNEFGWQPGILFAIQFVWQFPHFWAIAWVLDEDYKRAGIRLLPGSGQDIRTAFQIMIYTLFLIPLGFIPYLMGMTGIVSAFVALLCGVLFLAQTFYLMKECSRKAALQIMFGSFLYLPIVQIAFVLDKI